MMVIACPNDMSLLMHSVKLTAFCNAATDPKNWIRYPADSDPDPDPLTNGTFFHQSKISKIPNFGPFHLKIFKLDRCFHENFKAVFKLEIWSKNLEQILKAQIFVLNLTKMFS